jgi:hypothetical protein
MLRASLLEKVLTLQDSPSSTLVLLLGAHLSMRARRPKWYERLRRAQCSRLQVAMTIRVALGTTLSRRVSWRHFEGLSSSIAIIIMLTAGLLLPSPRWRPSAASLILVLKLDSNSPWMRHSLQLLAVLRW